MAENIKNVGVIGAGTMGLGIAQIVAMAGYKVQLYDVAPKAAKKALTHIETNLLQGIEKGKVTEEEKTATLDRIIPVENLSELYSDLVIEAIIEKYKPKKRIFSALEKTLEDKAIICTNTSSISVTKLAGSLKNGDRFLGMHFFNPAHIMKLVEIVKTEDTEDKVLNLATDFVRNLAKTPIVAKDSPGFIVNRVARHFYVESLRILEEKVASFENIDKLVEATGFKMGPFRLMDLIGVDTNFAVTSTMYDGFHQNSKFRPSRIQAQKVAAGHLGKKSGRGFYSYE